MLLHHTSLFKDTNIDTSNTQIKQFPAGYIIELEGSISAYVGVILEGAISVVSYTVSGHPIIINTLTEGMVYGDILLYGSRNRAYPGNLVAKKPTTVAIIPNDTIKYLLHTNNTFNDNFLTLVSNKVYHYNYTSKLLSQDSIRDKILYFIHEEQQKQQSNTIRLNMTKEDLAQKLHIQRPSLSRELIHMRDEGLIEFDRWTITLLG